MPTNLHPLVADHPALVALDREAAILDQAKADTSADWKQKTTEWETKEAEYKAARREALANSEPPPAAPSGEPDWEFRRAQVDLQLRRRTELDKVRRETLANLSEELDAQIVERHDAILDEVREYVSVIQRLADEAATLRSSLAAVRNAAGDPRKVPGGRIDVEALVRATRGGSFIDADRVSREPIRFAEATHF